MEANTGNPASPHWRTLYEAAVLELNPEKILGRIAEAQGAVMNRMEDLNRSSDGSEGEALINALNVLRDLCKMAEAEDRSHAIDPRRHEP
jgi:hypothetical protein